MALQRQNKWIVTITDRAALEEAFLPFLINGGLFIPVEDPPELGAEVFLMVHLLDEPTVYPVTAKVAWLEPGSGGIRRPGGMGIHFLDRQNPLLKRIQSYINLPGKA